MAPFQSAPREGTETFIFRAFKADNPFQSAPREGTETEKIKMRIFPFFGFNLRPARGRKPILRVP